jgi:aryl carrier-like protein
MAPHHAIEALAHVLRRDTAQVVVTAFDWPRFFRSFPRAAGDPDLSRMATESSAQVTPRPSGKGNTTPSLAALRGRTSDENQGILLGYLTHAVGQALGLHPSEVDAQAPLASMGLDSLMAIDLKNRMATDHGLEVSIVALIDGISVTQLAGRLAEHLASPRAAKPVLPPAAEPIGRVAEGIDPEKARELLVDLDKLSDAQVAQLLRMTSSEA